MIKIDELINVSDTININNTNIDKDSLKETFELEDKECNLSYYHII